MLPWGHAAVGYLFYVWYSSSKPAFDPHSGALIALLVGTQFPDIIDKPLGWTFDILPSGRSLAHSLITATIVLAVTLFLVKRLQRWYLGTAFNIGYFSHLLADSFQPAIQGQRKLLTNLGWPLLPPPAYGHEGGFRSHAAEVQADVSHGELTVFFWLQIGLVLIALGVAAYIEWTERRSKQAEMSNLH